METRSEDLNDPIKRITAERSVFAQPHVGTFW